MGGTNTRSPCLHTSTLHEPCFAACFILTDSRKRNASLERRKLLKCENFHGPTLAAADNLIDTGGEGDRSDLSVSHSPWHSGKGAVRRMSQRLSPYLTRFQLFLSRKSTHMLESRILFFPSARLFQATSVAGCLNGNSPAGLSHRDQ